ncbi:MAG: hypothetical protein LBU89_10680, partial [Fibromonadaceae bacterium]|jgi:predicted transposase YdaD|nr:hypothetical protein [Fibromonadaceae bacterium]
MADRSPTLSGYEEFISVIRDNLKSMNLRDAIRVAIRDCISRNILVYFLKRHGSEVENMLLTEWNWDDAKSVWQEEARETGWEKGLEEGRNEGREERTRELFALLESGVSLTEAKQKFGLL